MILREKQSLSHDVSDEKALSYEGERRKSFESWWLVKKKLWVMMVSKEKALSNDGKQRKSFKAMMVREEKAFIHDGKRRKSFESWR